MTADAAEIVRLAELCEAGTTPSRDLDALIAPLQGLRVVDEGHPLGRVCYDQNGRAIILPRYTASLDAAMSLVDGVGVLLGLSDIGADGLPLARVGVPDLPDAPVFTGIASCIMTKTAPAAGLAIAVTAAALKARARAASALSDGEG